MNKLKVIRQDIIEGEYRLTVHAHKRMSERNITHSDIVECAQNGVISEHGEKYNIDGQDEYGQDLTVVCAYKDGVLIITVY